MAEADSTASGTSSTPPAGSPPAAVEPATAAPSVADASKPAGSAQAAPAAPADAGVQDGAPKPATAGPLFTLPEDFTVPDEARSKFEAAIKGAMVDGKLNVTPQQIADWYVDQARDANAAWQKQIETTNAANEAACKQRFSAPQLAAAETAVGWFSSLDPAFREVAKRQLNDPTFTNAMRIVGEMLSEDTFETASRAPPPSNRPRTRAEAAALLYPKKPN